MESVTHFLTAAAIAMPRVTNQNFRSWRKGSMGRKGGEKHLNKKCHPTLIRTDTFLKITSSVKL